MTTDPESRRTFPLTDLQAGYLVGSSPLIELGGFRPTMYVELDVVGFDPDRARAAVDRLIERHEHLRTEILAEGGQRVLPDARVTPFPLAVTDLTGLPPADREAALRAVRERIAEAGVEPTGWPLFQVVAQRLRRHRWRLHLAMSLLLLDSTSTRHLLGEWWQLYQDSGVALPPVARTFAESVRDLAAWRDTEPYRAHWRYWEQRLDTLPEAPQLPLARPLAGIDPVRLVRRVCHLSRAEWDGLCAAARRQRVLPPTALLQVFAEVLGSWAAQPRFCLNVLHQNLPTLHPELAGVVGQLSATLPLEVDLGAGEDLWDRARRSQRQLWRDMAHSDVTAVQVTRELAARRGWTSRAALPYVFNSMLAPRRPAGAAVGRPVCRQVDSHLRTPQVLVDNQLQDAPDGGVDCIWDVVDDAFPAGLPEAAFEAYERLLRSLAGGGAPADPVPPAHRAVVARDNAPAGPPPAGRLEDGFLRRAAERPDHPAVVTDARTLSYGELASGSAAVAAALRRHGVGPGDLVPVVMAKGWEQVVAVLGVLRAGAAYCPVDVALPAERIGHLLDECPARVALVQSHRPADLGGRAVPAIEVDRLPPTAEPVPPVGPATDLAYVIWTSGSTGRPKGVAVAHRAALNTVADINRRFGLGPDDRVFGISSLSFDLSVWDVFGTLAAGATLVLPAGGSRPDPVGWADTATRHGATVWNSVPALAQMLVEVVATRPAADRPPVRAFLLSGDWVPTTLPDRLRETWPGTRVTALGGATEAAIWSNSYEVRAVDPAWRSIPYGRPLPNQTMRVLDDRLRLRPPWAVGGIHIGGVGLAEGYWRDPERTAERFVTDPTTGERLYRTGDLGRYWPDGTIEFLGREDRQVKVQGFRVEPGEIEAVARTHPGVRDCAVTTQQVPGGQRRLVAIVVPEEEAMPDPAALAGYLRERLPAYLVPARIHLLDRLPLSGNGKVDLDRALAAAEAATRDDTPATVDGASPVEERICRIWTELLEVPAVRPDDDFFALGGNSLLALRLVQRLRADLGTEVPFGQIFDAPTVRGLAARLTAGDGAVRCAVPLAEGAGRALFLCHPVGGSVARYAVLARAWDGPVYGFQSHALAGGDVAGPAGLADMAAGYRAELRRLAPHGPYLLAGWSMGGVLAHELAAQLRDEGEAAQVVLIDSDIHTVRLPADDRDRHREFLTDLAGGRLPAPVGAALAAAPEAGLAGAAHAAARAAGLIPAELDEAGYRRLVRVHGDNLAALAAHRPAPGVAPVLLVVADRVARPDPVPAWRAICPELTVERWPEDHHSIVSAVSSIRLAERIARFAIDRETAGADVAAGTAMAETKAAAGEARDALGVAP
ncbi:MULTISPECIES: non-ribosomal peptide synthetase [Micromonospora]|uniref:Amino acid adenylation domain-containing protein n=1 Tax=Micromonospora solifontis TaxID=2487138 RepID=A0ABX9WFK3_9ACTN|nr:MULTISPECIES: non-ribosomal peptide synthetase [Micromonospora]NES15065.1 amino acid adenylation domain-containing protein [Micromonospora sp. PPF5-17B]NES37165.1 amino acid adenylation domain-containing protein [Micromonospora solifontis]NES56260.1 amino acid adenylation domain-containing protein [Micromonospora sp. PPF5-6]RNL98617.1 amino acid adenylation domain-containing protein [Micromonospora solifontis]